MDDCRIKRILIVVQRSNGDVFLSSPLIEGLFRAYGNPQIDLLINDDTLAIARTLPHIENIYQFSYKDEDKGLGAITFHLLKKIARRYDMSISLTASDRSVMFALAASGFSISAVDASNKKSWWKRLLLSHHYNFDSTRHIIENNTTPLDLLGIGSGRPVVSSHHSSSAAENIEKMLDEHGISRFVIFHPGAQYRYKVYPETLRNRLLEELNTLGIALVVTGSKSALDLEIKRSIPKHNNIHDFIGETTIDEFIALSDRSLAYIGADTLNMHIAASQNKRIFAIYGPTFLSMWSPWCNALHAGTRVNKPVQTYGNITLFQADMPCVACGKAGCDDHHGISECLYQIDPLVIKKEIEQWLTTFR
ncbi:MAG: glycosyltransferase family 9 protein [Chlorobiaceae bacterium]|jgi:heptosyltransferase III|nr:glycosyltransferase family 9 protein [Chlorobiaceae bacterium]